MLGEREVESEMYIDKFHLSKLFAIDFNHSAGVFLPLVQVMNANE